MPAPSLGRATVPSTGWSIRSRHAEAAASIAGAANQGAVERMALERFIVSPVGRATQDAAQRGVRIERRVETYHFHGCAP